MRVSATNTLAINYGNSTAASITPPSETYIIGNFQMPIDSTAGNSWIQDAAVTNYQNQTLLTAVRTALVSLGAMAGA